MSDVGTIWTVFAMGVGVFFLLVWLIAGTGMRRWWSRSMRCPRGEHVWVWSGEVQTVASRRYCRWCGLDDPRYRDRERKMDGSKVTRAWTVTDTRMVAVHGSWGEALDSWMED